MSIYNTNGEEVFSAYDPDGSALLQAYDIDGNELLALTELKVMTYNVGQWYIGSGSNVPSDKDSAYYALQNGMIANANADILFLNEYVKLFSGTGRTSMSLLEQYFPYVHEQGASNSSGYFGRCLCSKYPISDYVTHGFWVGTTSYYYDSAKITIGSKTINLILLHLMVNPESNRYQQAQQLLSFLETLDTFIAAGDYNTGISPDNDTDNVNSTEYAHYIKLFTDEGYHVANCGAFGFLTTCNDGIDGAGTNWDIDNIITSSDITITSAYVDTTKLTDGINEKTDHVPLIATVEI